MTATVISDKSVVYKKLSDLGIPNLTGSLDFRDASFKIGSASVAITDVITCTRANTAGSYNGAFDYSIVNNNLPRTTVDPTTMRKGLMVEAMFVNSLLNSMTPATRSLAFTLGSKIAAVLECIGTGSVEVKDGTTVLGIATQDTPFVYVNSGTGNQTLNLTLTVSGSLQYYCLYSGTGNRKRVTRIVTTTAAATYNSDVIQVNASQLATLFNNGEGCVVIKQNFPSPLFNRNLTNSTTLPFFQFLEAATTNGIFVNRMENGSRPNFLRLKDAVVEPFLNSAELSENNTMAINFSKTGAKLAMNGVIGQTLSFSGTTDLTRMYLGSGITYTTNGTQVLQEVLFFNRQLTDQELLAITTA
ncbi:hypothetical protein ODQ17_17170 [Acinetobacter sp. IRS14]|uniref:hypothetical protein n=1 Tax=Acinetobacter sp. IRS14 TaxID=2983398 RepID=UPI002AFE8077|nr:hypothetical protein [Acinetobacter sp. IRS14]MEA1231108.1 hypothetical protein [Acinetobacter sp. IRS14]